MSKPALLALANGDVFEGVAIGHTGYCVGELVFNTAMTGYQEILTDPSYCQQIVTFTYPHIGNVGINLEDNESQKAYVAGCVIRDLPLVMSNWRAKMTLEEYLIQQSIVGIAQIDTRALTHILREQGAQHACIMTGNEGECLNKDKAISLAGAFPGLVGKDLAVEVSTEKSYSWLEGLCHWQKAQDPSRHTNAAKKYQVVVYDFGVKQNILRLLVEQGCELTVVPAKTSASEVLALKPDGVFLSNGPGDPAACAYAIDNIKKLLEANLPIFGICLGHQLLSLACGAKTEKMKFGHHGANHPVQNLTNKQVLITSQNHGFAVSEINLPDCLTVTHRSLFDNSIQGIIHQTKPAFGFQGHPEASPGPHDIVSLFEQFTSLMSLMCCNNLE